MKIRVIRVKNFQIHPQYNTPTAVNKTQLFS